MDSVEGLFAGATLLWFVVLVMAVVLLFFLPFFVWGIYNQTKKTAKEAEKGRKEIEVLNNKFSALFASLQKKSQDGTTKARQEP